MCVLTWRVRSLLCAYAFSQKSQWYGFSPVCLLIWHVRSTFHTYAFSQNSQWYGFSPVCVLIWRVRWSFRAYAFSQNLHLYVFSPVCMIRCCVRLSFPVNVLSHYSHKCNWYSLFFAFFILIFFLWLCVTCCVFLFKFSLVRPLSHTLQCEITCNMFLICLWRHATHISVNLVFSTLF